MPYPGNAGDSLIQFATARLLDELGIVSSVDPAAADVILVPGGNPSMWNSIGVDRWRALWRRFPKKEFVVGPSSWRVGYSDWAAAVNREGAAVSGLFARDPASFRTLNEAGIRPEIVTALSHDPALSLRGTAWLAEHQGAVSQEYDLLAFRNDYETNLRYPALFRILRSVLPGRVNRYLTTLNASAVAAAKVRRATRLSGRPTRVRDASHERFEVFVETVRAAGAVHTDRLHVMLLAALLEKKIYAYATSHAKLETVYRHSLEGWADVTLVGE